MLDAANSITALPTRLSYADPPGTPSATLSSKAKGAQQDALFSGIPSWKDSLYDAFVDDVPARDSDITPAKERKRSSINKEMNQMMGTFAVSHEF